MRLPSAVGYRAVPVRHMQLKLKRAMLLQRTSSSTAGLADAAATQAAGAAVPSAAAAAATQAAGGATHELAVDRLPMDWSLKRSATFTSSQQFECYARSLRAPHEARAQGPGGGLPRREPGAFLVAATGGGASLHVTGSRTRLLCTGQR